MNYYNPYYTILPYTTAPAKVGFFRSLFGRSFDWSAILSNTQKVLGIANQAIPMVKQITPVMKNAKTMFQVMNEFKKVDTKETKENIVTQVEEPIAKEGPTFFA